MVSIISGSKNDHRWKFYRLSKAFCSLSRVNFNSLQRQNRVIKRGNQQKVVGIKSKKGKATDSLRFYKLANCWKIISRRIPNCHQGQSESLLYDVACGDQDVRRPKRFVLFHGDEFPLRAAAYLWPADCRDIRDDVSWCSRTNDQYASLARGCLE